MSRESTAIRRGCCAAESGRPGSAEKSPAVDCVEAEKSTAKPNTLHRARLIKAQQSRAAPSDSHQSNNSSSRNGFICVISSRWRAAWRLCACFCTLSIPDEGAALCCEMSLKRLSADFITKLMQLPRREQRVHKLLFCSCSSQRMKEYARLIS